MANNNNGNVNMKDNNNNNENNDISQYKRKICMKKIKL
jgi:hypothetical protein